MKTFLIIPFVSAWALACGQAGIRPGEEIPAQADVAGAPAAKVERIRQRAQATADGDFGQWQSLHTPGCLRFAPELPEPLTSSAEMRAALERLKHAFPNYRLDLVRAVGNDTLVVAEFVTQGTFRRALVLGNGAHVPPTGRSFRQRAIFVFEFEGELIKEVREYFDQQELNQELFVGGQ